MPRRLRPLRSAALLAVGFVVLRVVYRIVFGGTDGGGAVVLDLPTIPLAGPFADISLFGPVTTGGLVHAVMSALPFAALVLAFGVVAAIIDLRALLSRGAVRGPVRTISRSLVIAWATFPALLESVRAVRRARELRGERSAASLVVPVLERTVERAIALGASMELRGFAAHRSRQPLPGAAATFAGVTLGFVDRVVLRELDLTFGAATVTLISGPTGSGKSTLIHSLSGLFQHVSDGVQRGRIEVAGLDRSTVPPRETAEFIGVVPQNVRLSFVAATVSEEIGFALAIRSVAADEVRERVAQVAEGLGITHLLPRQIDALSAGEACLVAIAAAVVNRPRLLLLDEPLADLDAPSRKRVIAAVGRLATDDGVCVIVAEHALEGWGSIEHVRLVLRQGLATSPDAAIDSGDLAPAPLPWSSAGTVVARVSGVCVDYGGIPAVTDATFSLVEHEIVALTGANGAGKSSLLLELARPSATGSVVVRGDDVSALSRRARRRAVALVPEAVDDLLFETTVSAECRRADRRRRVTNGEPSTVDVFLGLLRADAPQGAPTDARVLLRQHPRDLSAGERLCLVLAIQLSADPAVLLVDEPSRGLDAAARHLVGEALQTAAARGTAVVIATHDREFAARYASRTMSMVGGRLETPIEVGS